MEFILLMGILLLIFAVILPFRLQLKVEKPDCPQDIRAVRNNKIGLISCAAIGAILIVLYLIL